MMVGAASFLTASPAMEQCRAHFNGSLNICWKKNKGRKGQRNEERDKEQERGGEGGSNPQGWLIVLPVFK